MVLCPIITLNERVALFPDLSVATQITWLEPNGNRLPEGGLHAVIVLPSTVSDAFVLYDTLVPSGSVACLSMLFGSLKVGGVVSFTVTLNIA